MAMKMFNGSFLTEPALVPRERSKSPMVSHPPPKGHRKALSEEKPDARMQPELNF
jgi:hypothetical protein